MFIPSIIIFYRFQSNRKLTRLVSGQKNEKMALRFGRLWMWGPSRSQRLRLRTPASESYACSSYRTTDIARRGFAQLSYSVLPVDLEKQDDLSPHRKLAVVLHGMLGNKRNLRSFTHSLSRANPSWRFVLLDHLGHGSSPRTTSELGESMPHATLECDGERNCRYIPFVIPPQPLLSTPNLNRTSTTSLLACSSECFRNRGAMGRSFVGDRA